MVAYDRCILLLADLRLFMFPLRGLETKISAKLIKGVAQERCAFIKGPFVFRNFERASELCPKKVVLFDVERVL